MCMMLIMIQYLLLNNKTTKKQISEPLIASSICITKVNRLIIGLDINCYDRQLIEDKVGK